jgi:hypothetical protein
MIFIAHLRDSPGLKQKALNEPSIDAAAALAKEAGFDLGLE